MLPAVTIARSSYDGAAISYVFPVLWMMSGFSLSGPLVDGPYQYSLYNDIPIFCDLLQN